MAPNPAILVAYATSTGTTREIAERIAATLKETTAPANWRVDCKPVSDISSLHKALHRQPTPPSTPAPTPAPAETPNGTTPHPIEHPNPLSALIPEDPEPQPADYKAVIIGSSIHAGQWIGSGRRFLSSNHEFFSGKCCTSAAGGQTGGEKRKSWFAWAGPGIRQQEPVPAAAPKREEIDLPKIYAFSVGMPGNDDRLMSEQQSVEAALRKTLGRRRVTKTGEGGGETKEEEVEVLERHILFRGQWSFQQLEVLAPRVARMLRWCMPADSKIMKADDERDWKGIEKWAREVGQEVMGGGTGGA